MAHSCPNCDQACYCDQEDVWHDKPESCTHECDDVDQDDGWLDADDTSDDEWTGEL